MAKERFGLSKQGGPRTKTCPKCGTRMEIRICIRIKINHKIYGQDGRFWVCKNTKQREKGREEYDVLCDYREHI